MEDCTWMKVLFLDESGDACAIRKDEHLARCGVAALDPYMLSFDVLVEQFCFNIGDKPEAGVIVAEKRGPPLDLELDVAWLNLKVKGTRHLSAQRIAHTIVGVTTRTKRDRLAGLQLADLVVSPIGRHVLGRTPREDFRIIEQKLRRHRGAIWARDL